MKLTIAKQIVIGFLIVPLLLAGIGGMSYRYLQQIDESYDSMMKVQAAAASSAHVIQFDAAQQMNFLSSYMMTSESQYLDGFRQTNSDLNELNAKIVPLLAAEEQESVRKIQELNKRLLEQADRVSALLKSDPKQAELIIRQEVLITGTNIKSLSKELVDRQELLMEEMSRSNSALIGSTKELIVIASAIAIVIALLTGIAFAVRISRPISLLTKQLKNIAQGEGDLTQEIQIKSKDEFGLIALYFNEMVRKLRSLMLQIHAHAETLAAQAEQLNGNAAVTGLEAQSITDTIQHVASGTDLQHEHVEESSKAVGVISQHAGQIAGRSEQVSTMVHDTKDRALEGNQAIETAMSQMSAIHASLAAIENAVLQLEERAVQIEESTLLITSVARKTNLIALNAGIESSRAGEQGRSFAVVAGEVRSLAVQSSKSAETVTEMIFSIREEAGRITSLMKASANEIERGLQDVNRARSAFDSITHSIQQIDKEMGEVASASGQMASDLRDVTSAIGSIAEVAATNADSTKNIFHSASHQQQSVQDITSSIRMLSELAGQLQDDIRRFKIS
ncbi:methyl-accepting chemotaxis protein [Paenibacillus chartarius]|uniref:Methyl-accepting chemotaxis protein n=1 Tax=Paenibacillus chartarius TaxID=747481 RepID=A0ABV6DPC2_9BACL